MTTSRRPAADLIDAIVENMRGNLEELRYTTIAPSRYTVFLSPAEYARLEGLIPRLQAESIRALDEELARINRKAQLTQKVTRFFRPGRPPLENADIRWQVDFLPDMDGDLKADQDILVQSDLIIPAAPELGAGERTRRVKTVHATAATTAREDLRPKSASASSPATVFARLTYQDQSGAHHYDIVRDSTTIGRGGTMYPVDVRTSTTDDVSREHARIRRNPTTGEFFLIDLSTHGTSIDGRPIPRGFDEAAGGKRENGVEVPLPARARIGLAGTVTIDFEKVS